VPRPAAFASCRVRAPDRVKPTARKPVPVDRDQWSESSRRSLDYEFAPPYYEDKPFICRACGGNAVFTAEQQRHEYEVKKAFTWQQHVLCHPCFVKRHEPSAENDAFLRRWTQEKARVKEDALAVRRWIEVLEQLPQCGARQDAARLRMLRKLLGHR
jgi:Probable zinc-ribbon domain